MQLLQKKIIGKNYSILFNRNDKLSWNVKCSILSISSECYILPSGTGFFSKLYDFSPQALAICLYLGFDLSTVEGINACIEQKEYIKNEWSDLCMKFENDFNKIENFLSTTHNSNLEILNDEKFISLIELLKLFLEDDVINSSEKEALYKHAELLNLSKEACDDIISKYNIEKSSVRTVHSVNDKENTESRGPINYLLDVAGNFIKNHFQNVHDIQVNRVINSKEFKSLHKNFGMNEKEFVEKSSKMIHSKGGVEKFNKILEYDVRKSRYSKYF
jgi:hypothetical protein